MARVLFEMCDDPEQLSVFLTTFWNDAIAVWTTDEVGMNVL